jgi:importin subunit beta-1
LNLILAALLLPRVPEILDLVNRSLSDEERTESVVRLSFGLVGDLAETFANGQIKQFLLAEWVGQQLRSKARMSADTKRTARWAREVSRPHFRYTHGH